jgi:hypothetical protein
MLDNFKKKIKKFYYPFIQKYNTTTFNLLYLEPEELDNYPDLYHKIYIGEIDGVVIRNFFSKDEVQRFLKNYADAPSKLVFDKTHGEVFGFVIQEAKEKDLNDYFTKVKQYEEELKGYLGFDFNERIQNIIKKISNISEVGHVQVDENKKYLGSAVKFMQPGQGGLIEHVGLQFYDQYESLKDLESRVDKSGQLSFFTPLQYSEKGGSLILFDVKFGNIPFAFDKYYDDKLLDYIKSRKCFYLKPGIGDLLLFNGGHIWHRVEAIGGSKPRITIGGFTSYLLGRKKIVHWS